MMDVILQERVVENKDWATVLFVLCFVLIAITKTTFESRFSDFSKLLFSDKYNKIYKESSHLLSWFNIALFAVQLISLAFFAQLLLAYFGRVSRYDWLVYIQIITLIGVFILSKYLIEKIISTSFNMEEFVEQYNLQKVNYRTYISLLLLPVNLFLFYNDNVLIMVIYVIIAIILVANLLTYLNSLKIYQNLIVGKLFYFILYLCALEIAPYYFIYYWFTRS